MTTIDVHTSPLQAAREWRGVSMVSAALNAGLTAAQVEALETGSVDEFASTDEMIAAAVVYGASLGIGRDEAMALLDRTVLGTGAEVELPDVAAGAFSNAVRERSARIADRGGASTPVEGVDALAVEPMHPVHLDAPVLDPITDDELLVPEPVGPTPEQAVSASQEMHVVDGVVDAPWERRGGETGELEAWVADVDPGSFGSAPMRRVERHPLLERIGATSFSLTERMVGTERAEVAADWIARVTERGSDLLRQGRERLRESEHATLIVAIGGGAVLIALIVAIGGALGGDEPQPAKKSTPAPAATTTAAPATGAAAPAAGAATPATPAAVKPMVPASRLTVNVYNAGSKKGSARRVADELKAATYRIGQVGNDKGDFTTSTVIHPAGMEREAKVLARRVGAEAIQKAPGTTKQLTVVIV